MVHSGCTYTAPNIRLHWFAYNPSLGKSEYGSFEPNGELLSLMAPEWLVKRRQRVARGYKEFVAARALTSGNKRAALELAREALKLKRSNT